VLAGGLVSGGGASNAIHTCHLDLGVWVCGARSRVCVRACVK
jgi:hypothetical protein